MALQVWWLRGHLCTSVRPSINECKHVCNGWSAHISRVSPVNTFRNEKIKCVTFIVQYSRHSRTDQIKRIVSQLLIRYWTAHNVH
jgi:hypothetical protein